MHTVDNLTNNICFGKDTLWKMKNLKIPSFYRIYYDSSYIQTYKYLNTNHNNMIYHILTMNKNRKLTAQNKCG